MPPATHDYRKLEELFIRGEMSVRALCRSEGIASVSPVHDQAKKKDARGLDWYEKRRQFQANATQRTMQLLANKEAERRLREADVRANALGAIDDALTAFRRDLTATRKVKRKNDDGQEIEVEEPVVRVNAEDISRLISKLTVVFDRGLGAGPAQPEGANGATVGFNLQADAATPTGRTLASALASALERAERGGDAGLQPRRVGRSDEGDVPGPRDGEDS